MYQTVDTTTILNTIIFEIINSPIYYINKINKSFQISIFSDG